MRLERPRYHEHEYVDILQNHHPRASILKSTGPSHNQSLEVQKHNIEPFVSLVGLRLHVDFAIGGVDLALIVILDLGVVHKPDNVYVGCTVCDREYEAADLVDDEHYAE